MSSARTEIDFDDTLPPWFDRIITEIDMGNRFVAMGQAIVVPHPDGHWAMAPSPAAFFVPTDYGVH